MSFYKLAKARTSELERPEKKIKIDYGDSKRVDIAKYHDDLTKGKVKQDYDSIRSHHHDKINHSDYLISQTNLGKTDLLKNKLLSERMAQLNATKYESVQEVDINLGIGSDNAVVQEVNQVIGDFIQKISSGVFDLTMTNDLYKLYKLIQTQTYKFGTDLLERYKSYFEDVKETLNLDETADVVRSYSRKDSSVLDLMTKIVENSINIIDKMLEAIVSGKSSEERKQILEQDVKNITFKKIDRTYLKELSDEIKSLEKSRKSEKDSRKNAKNQALLEQLKNIEKVARMPEMQKQGLFLQEEREEEIRLEEERRRQAEEEERLQVEEARRVREENIGMAEEEGRTRFVNAKEKEERERIRRITEDRLRKEREEQEKIKAEEERLILDEYERLTAQTRQLDEELQFIFDSRRQINVVVIPQLIDSINDMFPEMSKKTVRREINDYIVAVMDETSDGNPFFEKVNAQSATEGANLKAIALAILGLEQEILRINGEMEETRTEIARLPTGLEDLVEERTDDFLGDMERDLLEGAEPLPVPEPVPEPAPKPAPKPKKEETATEEPLFKTSEYSSTGTKITMVNALDTFYFRNKEQFIENQSKPALIYLLNKLDIKYNKWSSTTKGDKDNVIALKAFRTKAWDELKDNPKLKLRTGTHWFKK